MLGKIHSIESMGTKDGPGLRTVIFFQGCHLRCAYCHNPDTWDPQDGKKIEPSELLKKVMSYKSYFEASGGGVTCSGGEPLLQPEFLFEFLYYCKQNGIHTALDTSGYGHGSYDEILKLVDLVILDIKQTEKKAFNRLTGGNIERSEQFHDAIRRNNNKLWIRHVVVPGLNDDEISLKLIKNKINSFKNVEKVEFLPYHTLGVYKYEKMNLTYRLDELLNTSLPKL